MRRGTLAAVAALALAVASCAADGDTSTTIGAESPVTTSPVTTSSVDDAPATTSPVTTQSAGEEQSGDEEPTVDGDPAPDFTLALDGGGEFTLSGEQKPVYMIFWAEW